MRPLDLDLFRQVKEGDREARETLFHANTGLIWACARKYSGLVENEDLFQLGAIGLLKAVDRFDASYGVLFSTFAVPHILGEIRRYVRDNTPVKVERRLKEVSYRARKAIDRRRAEIGREPSAAEIAEEIGVPADVLLEAMDATSPPVYLEEIPSYGEKPDGGGDAKPDTVEIADALDSLDAQMRAIVMGRFFEGKTQTEVSKDLGISQAHVCRLEKAALLRLRVYLAAEEAILP